MCHDKKIQIELDVGPNLKDLILNYMMAAGVKQVNVNLGELLANIMGMFEDIDDDEVAEEEHVDTEAQETID